MIGASEYLKYFGIESIVFLSLNIEGKAYTGNATQNIDPPLSHAKDTHTHTTTHTALHIHLLVKNTRETYT